MALNMKMTRALHEAGAGIILGTDSDNPFLIPGLSLLDELDYLTAAGFTPYEALVSGTRDAASVLGYGDVFGTIAPGKRADLLLLAANPLEDVRHVRQRIGVFASGRWWSEENLQGMLAELAASYRPTLLDRLWPLLLPVAAAALVIKRWF
jgi:imidazolonepropionase-like amidohydrolase